MNLEASGATLGVQRTKSTAKSGPVFTTPKNGKGRSITLTRHAVEALKAHRAAQNAERLKAGSLWQDYGLIFCTHGGRPLDSHNVARTSFKPLLERAELPHIRFHDLRHTCATLLLSRGHHPKLVQELLGALLCGPDVGPLQPRHARNGRTDRCRNGGGFVLKNSLRLAACTTVY